jgi:lysophospholipase L1-like esterase
MRAGAIISVAIVAIFGAAVAAGREGKRFSAYPTCKPGATKPDPYCFAGDRATASFRAHADDDVAYRLCVRKPGGERRCHDRRTEQAGKPSKVQLEIGRAGHYELSWRTGSTVVDRDELQLQRRNVFVNGDSLAEGTRPYIPRALDHWHVSQSVSISRHAPQGVAILRRLQHVPPVVVMSLGTNDDPRSTGAFRNAIRETMHVVGRSGCVVWPNIVRPPVGGASYAGYNQALAEESGERRNLRVVEWTKMVAANRSWLARDGVHVNAAGYQARAEAIAREVRRC